MNRNHKIALILAAVAVPLIILSMSASYQSRTTSAARINSIGVDFSLDPETNPIIVERGVTTSVPLKVEAPKRC